MLISAKLLAAINALPKRLCILAKVASSSRLAVFACRG
ncbi:hypothetical protein PALB_12850 [Pseudoalteromonas luteoviolacea B = ATCC 29581]|nr:hypothetical protein PALB_12850 [Pseudoalteromonas luteoviolacea B = ATCC 29581]